jgi:hypothetical protein
MNGSGASGIALSARLTVAVACLLSSGMALSASQPTGVIVLEDFNNPDGDGFPKGWKAQRNETGARQSYRIQSENGQSFLAVRKADQRVYKKIAWDPKANPIVTWRWRLKAAPAGAEPIAAVFVSLDTDLLVIPVATKYVWSGTKAKGSVNEGGVFDATEIVLRTGVQPVGEWVEERVNAYEDFKRIHRHEPAEQAWGISLLGGPGVDIDFGPIAVSSP